ncbi:DNA polymerase III subunit psi [Vibrio sp.]|uniref:DNA polymerase III subunit psi n=1 Tax=Vibrio sp. TaxID=678 RepID=UPI003D09F6E9
MHKDAQYLQQMGIANWTLVHPERLTGYQAVPQPLPAECQLLLVAPSCPVDAEAVLFENVLKSIGLNLSQARHTTPEALAQYCCDALRWVWFAGCDRQPCQATQQLETPPLKMIDGNPNQKRALWQQICRYQNG